MADAAVETAALETGEAAKTTVALETGEAAKTTVTLETGEVAKTTVALETGVVEAKKDCCYEESLALASNLEGICPPLAIQWFGI